MGKRKKNDIELFARARPERNIQLSGNCAEEEGNRLKTPTGFQGGEKKEKIAEGDGSKLHGTGLVLRKNPLQAASKSERLCILGGRESKVEDAH